MEQRYLTVAEVGALLQAESEARGYDFMLASQKAALDHAQKTCAITKEQADAIVAAALQLDFVTEPVAVKIADLLPSTPEDVRAIFAKERVVLEKEQIDAVIDIVSDNS